MGVVEEDEEDVDRSQGSRNESVTASIQIPDRSEDGENQENLL